MRAVTHLVEQFTKELHVEHLNPASLALREKYEKSVTLLKNAIQWNSAL
jgi:hypothetical protein